MVQRRATRFVKHDYRRTSVSSLISELGWDTLADRRKTSRLCSFYKGFNKQSSITLDHLARPTRSTRSNPHSDVSCFIPLHCRTDTFKYSFFTRTIVDWNALTCDQRFKPSVDAFHDGINKHC
jgi:hypothetical protein